MAFKTIGTHLIHEWEQEELEETKQVAGEDGVVETVTTFIQPYAYLKTELVVKQEQIPEENRSNYRAELWLTATAGEKGDGYNLDIWNSPYPDSGGTHIELESNIDPKQRYYSYITTDRYFVVKPNETIKKLVAVFDNTINVSHYNERTYNTKDITNNFNTHHYIDGTFAPPRDGADRIHTGSTLMLRCEIDYSIKNILMNGELVEKYKIEQKFRDISTPVEPIDRAAIIITADNFNDSGDAAFSYKAVAGKVPINQDGSTAYTITEDIDGLQAALSFDGENPVIEWRDIDINGTYYAFNLTEQEREILRQNSQGSNPKPIYYMTKIFRSYAETYASRVYTDSVVAIGKTERQFTVLGCAPILDPTVEDIKEETLALTGNKYKFIRYESMAEFSTGATASKYANIISQSVKCGSQVVNNLYNGVIQDVETATFEFTATDSRNQQIHAVLQATLIEYLKPTCKQTVEIGISGESTAAATIKVSGNWYNGSFGVVDNELTLQIRHGVSGQEFEDWQTLTPTYNGNTYEVTITLDGYNYEDTHIFQSRAIDKLNSVESVQYSTKLLPVYDWSKDDFNFNVPIHLNGQPVLRHNKEANNTVLSASGGHIYVRPKGTNDTEGETIFYPDGSVKFSGAVEFSEFKIGEDTLADYIIETGEESMGTNGTWYWTKWASGKSECWGCRNFGTMAITTTWGNLYRSEILTQALPSGVFKTTPDVININIVSANNGGWICKHENAAPSAVSTGSFIFVRPASATPAATYIGFHVIGLWK